MKRGTKSGRVKILSFKRDGKTFDEYEITKRLLGCIERTYVIVERKGVVK